MPIYKDVDDEEREYYRKDGGKDVGVSPIQTPGGKPWDKDPDINLSGKATVNKGQQVSKPWDKDPDIDLTSKPYAGEAGLNPNNVGVNPPSFAEDVLKSLGSGIVRGGIALDALPGDIAAGVDWIEDKTRPMMHNFRPSFAEKYNVEDIPQLSEEARKDRPLFLRPSSQAIKDFEDFITPLHEPTTTAGSYARTIGEFLPATAAGPGGLPSRVAGGAKEIAKAAGTRFMGAAVPAVGSETAGQLTKGSAMEPYARLIGGLGTSGAQAGLRHGAPPVITNRTNFASSPLWSGLAGYHMGGLDSAILSVLALSPTIKSMGDYGARKYLASPGRTPVDNAILRSLAGTTPSTLNMYPTEIPED